jgi:hypothetical protein
VVVDDEVLVSVEHEDGVAAVVRSGEWVCLSGYLGHAKTVLDGYESSMEGLTGERSAEGGLLPPGAVGAEVVDRAGRRHRPTCAAGAWVLVLDEPTIGDVRPVRFLDAEGNTVRRPAPDGWAREPAPDSHAPCPACGNRVWERIRALDGSSGMRWAGDHDPPDEPPESVPEVGGNWEPAPLLRCTTCGYAEGEPIIVSATFERDHALPEDDNPTSR